MVAQWQMEQGPGNHFPGPCSLSWVVPACSAVEVVVQAAATTWWLCCPSLPRITLRRHLPWLVRRTGALLTGDGAAWFGPTRCRCSLPLTGGSVRTVAGQQLIDGDLVGAASRPGGGVTVDAVGLRRAAAALDCGGVPGPPGAAEQPDPSDGDDAGSGSDAEHDGEELRQGEQGREDRGGGERGAALDCEGTADRPGGTHRHDGEDQRQGGDKKEESAGLSEKDDDNRRDTEADEKRHADGLGIDAQQQPGDQGRQDDGDAGPGRQTGGPGLLTGSASVRGGGHG